MMVKVLASGSRGNCTAVTVGDKLLLIDCGISYTKTLAKLSGRLPDAILITHEHGDHCSAAAQFIKRGVDIYATVGTFSGMKIAPRYNLHNIAANVTFETCGVTVTPIPSVHDAAEPVNFILTDATDRILYVTDTGGLPQVDGDFSKIFIEANYSEAVLLAANIDAAQKRRILHYHMSIEQAEIFLSEHHAAEVTLLHTSKRHGDEDEFKRRIAAIREQSGG